MDCESLPPTQGATQQSVDWIASPYPQLKGPHNKAWIGLRVPNPNSRDHATKRGFLVSTPRSRGHTTKRELCVPNPNSRGRATKRGLRLPNPNSRGHATKRGFKDCPGSLDSTRGLGPKEGRNATSPLHSQGSPTKRTKSDVKTYAWGHNDAPSISKYGSLVQRDAQIAAPPKRPSVGHGSKKMPGVRQAR